MSLQNLTDGSISVRNLWLVNCPIRVKCVLKGKNINTHPKLNNVERNYREYVS